MISYWVLAARVKTLPASICPVLVSLYLTKTSPSFNLTIAIITLCTALLIQIGTNFANDYFDYKKGSDTDDRVGPIRMTQSKKISSSNMKLGIKITFGLSIIMGIPLVYYGGWPILLIGTLAVFFGLIYTAGPYPLAYIGGAELISFLFFGPIAVIGTFYLQTFTWNAHLLYIGSALGLITTSLLIINNTRDIETDKKSNKKTFSVRFGRLFSYFEYLICIYTPLFLLDIITEDSTIQISLLLLLVFVAMVLSRRFGKAKKEQFNKLLSQTSLYLILFTLITIYLLS